MRQGCPLSALLAYIMDIQVLANKIRDDPDIKGIIIENKEIKITYHYMWLCLYISTYRSVKHNEKTHKCDLV